MRLDRPTTSVYFDTRFKSAIVFPVKIRVTFYRESKYYPTGVEVTKEDFERINGKRPTPEARERKRAIEGQWAHFEKVLDALPGFSFENLKGLSTRQPKTYFRLKMVSMKNQ
ncbi:MAG: hypothetical protein IPL23_19610 [Saprospiraceae bacterium]|nr:hypothetical protein [Saprospiraceae bacterium]